MLSGIRNDRFDVETFDSGEFMIIANMFDKNLKKYWSLVNVYGPAQDEFKESFLSELSNFCFKAKHPILMGGDFNILRFSSEKNKKFSENKFSSVFNLIINSYELRELTLSGGKFTWSNNRNNPTLEKLDRVLLSSSWEIEFPLCNLRKIPRYMSDHNPLIVRADLEQKVGAKPFCFENSWLLHADFSPKI
jgi:exonuclease III